MDEELASRLRRGLASGPALLGGFVFELTHSATVAQFSAAGLDFVLVDFEHSALDWSELLDFVQAARRAAIPVIVKISTLDQASVQKVLDIGATAIQLARTESAEQARLLVDFSRYPPAGSRAFCDYMGHTDFLGMEPRDVLAREEPLVIPMIESVRGLERLEEIVATPGLDALYIGASDLSVQLGVPGEYEHPTQLGSIERIVGACARAGLPVILNSAQPEASARLVRRGVRGLVICADVPLLRSGATAAVAAHRSLFGASAEAR